MNDINMFLSGFLHKQNLLLQNIIMGSTNLRNKPSAV